MAFTGEQSALLNGKLDPKNVKKPSGSFGPKGDYIEGWHAIAEANRIFGFDGWSYEAPDVKCVSQAERKIGRDQKDGWGVTYTAKVRVDVGGVVREDFGAGHGYDTDLGLAHESAIKEAVTDALKRALKSFGNPFGLALYDKTQANVGVDADPRNANIVEAMIGAVSIAESREAVTEWQAKQKHEIEALDEVSRERVLAAARNRFRQLPKVAA